jgi:hypothetical protein
MALQLRKKEDNPFQNPNSGIPQLNAARIGGAAGGAAFRAPSSPIPQPKFTAPVKPFPTQPQPQKPTLFHGQGSIGDSVQKFAQGIGGVFQGAARVPETVARSVVEPLTGNAFKSPEKAVSTASGENTGLRGVLYGKEPIKSYQEQARDAQIAAKNSQSATLRGIAPAAPFLAPVLAGLDLGTGGKGREAKKITEEVTKDALASGLREGAGHTGPST